MQHFKKVVVGISGGVDSAVAALLLKKKGFNVHGVFMQNWDIADEQGFCSADEDYKDAQIVCEKLKIPLLHVNFVKHYWNEVFCKLINEYENGSTPNPDILCNRHIKFNYFYKYAMDHLNADAIATGHYAKTTFGPFLEHYQPQKRTHLLLSEDKLKDQTFFLCQIGQEALQKTMFPLGVMTKTQVKQIATEHGLQKIAQKKESMGICFIGSRNFQNFISEYVENKPGDFIDIDSGEIIGKHNGFHHWTLGQRSRLPNLLKPAFIAKKDIASNRIYVAQGTKHPSLYTRMFYTSKPYWICDRPVELSKCNIFSCQFKFQHTHLPVDCEICETENGLVVRLYKKKRAITQGQYAVFYKGDECLGAAKIMHPGPSLLTLYWLENKGICSVSDLLRKYKRKDDLLVDGSEQSDKEDEFNQDLRTISN